MKRLFLLYAIVVLFAAPAVIAQIAGEVLLADDGALYATATEWSRDHPDVDAKSESYITVTIRRASDAAQRLIVPATLQGGTNTNPAIAYDNASATLFVFWQYWPNMMSSEMKFISYHAETGWSAPASFDEASYSLRRSLRIALTRTAADKDDDGRITWVSEVNVHATWWEETGGGESANYAMITIRDGEAAAQVHDLASFVTSKTETKEIDPDANRELLRHPAIFEAADGRSVDIVFGELASNKFHRVSISPIGNARVRVPVGIQDKTFEPPPSISAMSAVARIDAISPAPERMVFYYELDGVMHYLLYRDGKWSGEKTMAIDEHTSRSTILAGMRNLVGAQ
ncbi:MAG TPA: hypothetical protein VNA69_12035 [Thermoanaerobaculia bacterium]|nr:hypothetical protein [Thermoanaerobaculia bacterium]